MLLVLGQFQSSAQFGDAGPHHPFVLVPSTLAPALLLAAPTPKQNPPSPGHPGSSQHCPLQISHSRLGTPAHPVQPSLIWALLAILDSFPDTCTRRDSRDHCKTQAASPPEFFDGLLLPLESCLKLNPFPPIPSNSPILSSFHPHHRTARHTLAACFPPATQPRQTLRLTHTVTQDIVCQT